MFCYSDTTLVRVRGYSSQSLGKHRNLINEAIFQAISRNTNIINNSSVTISQINSFEKLDPPQGNAELVVCVYLNQIQNNILKDRF